MQQATARMMGIAFFFLAALLAVSAAEASSDVLRQTCDIVLMFWSWLRGAVYILGAIALALMSFQASIMGRFQMGNFVAWGGALFLVSSTPLAIAFLTSGSASLDCSI